MRRKSLSNVTRRSLVAAIALSLFTAASASAATVGLTGTLQLVSDGPSGMTTVQNNLALASNGSTAFALDELAGFAHFTAEANDGLYGNAFSWIGNGATGTSGPFIGVALPGSTQINSIAFGRDSGNPAEANQFTDRSLGTYTLQYRNDGSTADDLNWNTIGTITYSGSPFAPDTFAPARHQFTFDAVDATAVRLIVPATGLGGGTAIDEIELFNNVPALPGMTLIQTGPSGSSVPNNLALASNGATAFAQTVFANGGNAFHQIDHLNDGIYGNSNSWIGNADATFAGVDLGDLKMINQIAFGRDNGGEAQQFGDRAVGNFMVQYTTVANPDENTALEDWITLDILTYSGGFPDATPFLRHLYEFAPVKATGVRIVTASGGNAIDEIEVYGIPEPASAMLLLFGAAGLASRRRQRQ